MQNDLAKIEWAHGFWADVANSNGWSMDGRKVQVWKDEHDDLQDCCYLPSTATHNIVIDHSGKATEYN